MQDAMTCPTDIRHPVWCKHVHADAPLAEGAFALLGPAEPDEQHEGRSFTLDAGDTLAYTVTVTPVQWFGDTPSIEQAPGVRLTARNHELEGNEETIYLNPAEVDKLIHMLQRASQIL